MKIGDSPLGQKAQRQETNQNGHWGRRQKRKLLALARFYFDAESVGVIRAARGAKNKVAAAFTAAAFIVQIIGFDAAAVRFEDQFTDGQVPG